VVFELIEHLSSIFFTIIGWIMRLAPLAAFGAMAYIIGQYGISSLGSYAKLIAACYLGAVLFILILAAISRFLAGAVPGTGHGFHRGGASSHHGQADERRMLVHHNGFGGAN
jgi:Na+/H+-dicarboxylate symporter